MSTTPENLEPRRTTKIVDGNGRAKFAHQGELDKQIIPFHERHPEITTIELMNSRTNGEIKTVQSDIPLEQPALDGLGTVVKAVQENQN